MNLEITLPLKLVCMRKQAEVMAPLYSAADPRHYPYGGISPLNSLPAGYWFVGWLLRPPAVGEHVYVLRIVRNGHFLPGHFISTEVVEVPAEGEFHTMNSIYRWEEIGD